MSNTVLLIRHPESAWNRKGIYQGQIDTPLTAKGRAQAELVAARLGRERLAGLVCSPLQRARILAQAIARYHHLHPQSDNRLTEICHGAWEGLSRQEVAHRFPDMYQTWTEFPHLVTFPGGESLQDVHERSVAPIAALLARPENETWVVVTHDTVARLVVAAAQGDSVRGFSSVALENAAITTLVGPSLVGSIRRVNDVEHLGRLRVTLASQAL